MSYDKNHDAGRDVLIEFYRVGGVVKVSAVDPVTMTEVCIQGNASTDERHLRQAAIRKLRYRLKLNYQRVE